MKKGTKVKIVIASMALIILAVLVTYVVVKDKPNNEQSKGDEASQTANVEEKELLASTYVNETTNTKTNPSTADKIAKMETLMAGWGCNEGTKTGDKVKVVDVKIGGKDEEDEDDGDKDLTMPIPVPIGYTESKADGENTVNGGFVIYEGTEEVTNENVENAKKTRNQWVWVPVYDLDDICEYKNGELAGKLYNFNNDGRIECTDAREPDIVSNYDKDNYLTA